METSLCIMNERISAVVGTASGKRVRVKEFASVPLSEGTLINGVITDERLLTLALDELRDKIGKRALSNVRVALRSNQIFTKRMAVPAMPRRKILEWAAGEFADTAGSEELLCDYSILGKDAETGAQTALLCAAQKPMIESFITLLNGQGISIASIDTRLSAMIKLAGLLRETRESTFILLGFDGNSLDTQMFVGGEYHMSSSVRLFAERGTPESAAEISKQVSSLLQFNTARRSGAQVTHVYTTGLRAGEDRLRELLKSTYDLETGELTDEGGCIVSPADKPLPLTDYAGAVGNLIDW